MLLQPQIIHGFLFPKHELPFKFSLHPVPLPFLPLGLGALSLLGNSNLLCQNVVCNLQWQQEQIPVCPHIGRLLYTKEAIAPNSSLVSKCLRGGFSQEHGCGVINRRSNITQKVRQRLTKTASLDFLIELAGSRHMEESLLTSSWALLTEPYGRGLVSLVRFVNFLNLDRKWA